MSVCPCASVVELKRELDIVGAVFVYSMAHLMDQPCGPSLAWNDPALVTVWCVGTSSVGVFVGRWVWYCTLNHRRANVGVAKRSAIRSITTCKGRASGIVKLQKLAQSLSSRMSSLSLLFLCLLLLPVYSLSILSLFSLSLSSVHLLPSDYSSSVGMP